MGLSTVIAMGVFLFWFLVVLHGLCFRKNCPTYLTWPAPAAYYFPSSLSHSDGLDRLPFNLSKFISR